MDVRWGEMADIPCPSSPAPWGAQQWLSKCRGSKGRTKHQQNGPLSSRASGAVCVHSLCAVPTVTPAAGSTVAPLAAHLHSLPASARWQVSRLLWWGSGEWAPGLGGGRPLQG